MIPAAAFLLGVGVTCIFLVVVAWVAEARAESREMRRYSAMTAALSGMGTPRPPVFREQIRFQEAMDGLARAVTEPNPEAQRNLDDLRAIYLPESRDADHQP